MEGVKGRKVAVRYKQSDLIWRGKAGGGARSPRLQREFIYRG
ncbi:hypothetical protein HMPREF3185_01887 [Porphyromonas somerae]|uniref:Uncharacterized protein n=1 Tax=Porphyromonas somerae TaxID=322095 RepID=A0A134B1P7_9PORP|nr:hypothetical protein HMPREF3184_01887 [Porphyromonadaceae bacterium KA00676]KXB73868.1 hypothetical protein HMPREF3185_01887 [Porphyromonas somerae]